MGGTGRPLGKTFFLQSQRRHPELPKIPTYLPVLHLCLRKKPPTFLVGNSRPILLEPHLRRLNSSNVFRRFHLGAEPQSYLPASKFSYRHEMSRQLCAIFGPRPSLTGYVNMGTRMLRTRTRAMCCEVFCRQGLTLSLVPSAVLV